MCGIAGILDYSGAANGELMRSAALNMATALRHRGPDDSDVWQDPGAGIALSHRRLSVIDLSPMGHQPMVSASGRYVIVYNGEIYNFRALRNELEKHAHAFRGASDTEVILAAITHWGVRDALLRFNGMFAFALWDRQERALYLARDRFGEKPLYYGRFGNVLLFGSELKALRAYEGFEPTIDRDALGLFIQYGYVPTPNCIYRGVRKLPPGSMIRLSSHSTAQVAPESYWSVANASVTSMRNPFEGSDEDAVCQLDTLLEDAVRLRLEADVPLGAFLSGGIDSSAIVMMMQRRSSRPVKTFTVGFEEAAYNEAEDAMKVANYLGTEHTELYVTAREAMAVIPQLPHLYDEPFADSSQIPTYLICSLARRHVTVSLSGDAGDELLAGYNRYRLTSRILQVLLATPSPLRRFVGASLQLVPPTIWDQVLRVAGPLGPTLARQRHVGNKIHRLARLLLNKQGCGPYDAFMSVWDQPEDVVGDLTASRPHAPTNVANGDDLNRLESMMVHDAVTYLPDDILVKLDRASMGVSLETRVPFLDPRVAEFCWSLPIAMKTRNGKGKWLLREVLKKGIPSHLVDRPKTGFAVPIGDWLRGPIRDWAEELLSDQALASHGLLKPAIIRQAWSRHLARREDLQDRLWCILIFQSWYDEQRRSVSA